MKRIYLDYNATTPVHPSVAGEMQKYIYEYFGNPSSGHWYGRKAHEGVEKARRRVSVLLGCKPEEIVFTSGGTESNNYVIRGVAETFRNKGNHIITSAIEHPAIIKPCQYLEKKGYEITYLPVDRYGMVNPYDLKKAIRSSTILITIMHANNETGTIQPIKEISRIARSKKILVHTDAAQSVGKIPAKVNELGVDFLTIAGHKLYAPKGVGAIYIRRGIQIQPLILGAGHESGRRAGTENVIEIVGLGKACELSSHKMPVNSKRIQVLRNKLYNDLKMNGIKMKLNGHPEKRLPNILNLSFAGIENQILLEKMPEIAVSTGSACHSNSKIPSNILTAMGVTDKDAFSAVRFSLGLFTTEEEINYTVKKIIKVIKEIRNSGKNKIVRQTVF
ncbi:MAG: cysteine desulfurase family protein [Elusimicrobia bacterium]|nr:cysteine desulfurase family protein [Elusimicrobiota bacterium]